MRWYYVVNGDVVGPVRTHYISRIYEKGLINGETYVYNSKIVTDWTRYKKISSLVKDLVKKNHHRSSRTKNEDRRRKRRTKRYHSRQKDKHKERKRRIEEEESESESSSEEEEEIGDYGEAGATVPFELMQNHLTKEQKMVKNGDYVEIIGGKFGRVLYIGKVSGMLGEAIGLELSKPEGDSDGKHQGVRYFQCKPGYGMFTTRQFVKRVMLENHADRGSKKLTRMKAAVSDLNLAPDFDEVSFALAIQWLDLNYDASQVSKAYLNFRSAGQRCQKPEDQLELLLQILQNPGEPKRADYDERDMLDSDEFHELSNVKNRWRRFSQLNNL